MDIPVIDATAMVINVCVLDQEHLSDAAPDGCKWGPEGGQIGDRWDGSTYIRPPVAPEPVAPVDVPPVEAPPMPDVALIAMQAKIDSIIKALNILGAPVTP